MSRADWTCDYGLAVLPRVALMLDWASTRRAQLDRRTA